MTCKDCKRYEKCADREWCVGEYKGDDLAEICRNYESIYPDKEERR